MEDVTTTRKIRIDNVKMAKQLLEGIQGRPDQYSRSETPQQTASMDVVQTKVDEQPTELMRELPTPPETSTPEPTVVTMSAPQFMQTFAPTFTGKLERIITPQRFVNPFKNKMTSERSMVRRFQLESATPGGSGGLDTMQKPASSGSGAIREDRASGSKTLHG